MSAEAKSQTMEFQAEMTQLMKLLTHSLYSNKEIFLRELVSNASDACDKLRFEALSDNALFAGDSNLAVTVTFDKEARTVTVTDNGIGMSRDEVIANIGTIAKSGTAQFIESLTGDQKEDSRLIGQFGVGFYSAFVVADKVTLTTRRAGASDDSAVIWESTGTGNFTLTETAREQRGTEIVLHLNDEADEFLDQWRLRGIVKKYSDHITFPVMMEKEAAPVEEGEEETASDVVEYEAVNSASALWSRPKREITDEEYNEFYKQVCHDFEEPLAWTHNRVEGKYEYTNLLYIPKRAPFDLYERDQMHGIKLYVQRVFIMDDAEKLMPRYLRFVKGLVDSNDLPLNVSREILQSNKVIDSIRGASVKKILGLLEKMAKDDAEKYQSFWNEFGRALKEGPGEDFANREQLAKLLRYASTNEDSDAQTVSLDDYLSRMQPGQDKIYYITADNYAAAKNSPHLEVFRKKGIEVLLMFDRVDEWTMSHMREYEGKSFVSVAKGDLDLGGIEDTSDKEAQENLEKASEGLVKQIKESLAEKVEDVKVSHRLTSSPACIVLGEHDMALYMQQLMKQAGQAMPSSKPVLEINAEHPILQRMSDETDDDRFAEWSQLLFDQAVLAEGGQLEDAAGFVRRLNELMLALTK